MKSVLCLVATASLLAVGCGLLQGPCPPLNPVDITHEEWAAARGLFVNVLSSQVDVRCGWTYHYLTSDDAGILHLSHYFKYLMKEDKKSEVWSGSRVGPGHYVTTQELAVGRNSSVHVYFLYFDPPNLICFFTCTDDPLYRDVKGGLVCESATPDPAPANAPVIRRVAQENGFKLEDLMIVDNCKTIDKCSDHIPFEPGVTSKCKKVTVNEYFDIS